MRAWKGAKLPFRIMGFIVGGEPMVGAFEKFILGVGTLPEPVLAVGVPVLIVAAGIFGFWHIRRDLRRQK